MRAALALLLLLVCGCGETGQERVEVGLFARGEAARPVALGDAQLTLTRADIAFGPAYFCASEGARAELCEVALAELRQTVLVHGLDPSEQALGALPATTGEVRSSLYDYGISWLLTETAPRASEVAPGGHSAILEGTLVQGARTLRLSVALDVTPRARGDAALNGQRTSHVIAGAGERLTLTVDPQRWVDRLDPSALFALDGDGDGAVTLAPGTQPYESILQGMVNRAPIGFAW